MVTNIAKILLLVYLAFMATSITAKLDDIRTSTQAITIAAMAAHDRNQHGR